MTLILEVARPVRVLLTRMGGYACLARSGPMPDPENSKVEFLGKIYTNDVMMLFSET